MSRIYWDSMLFIYLFQDDAEFGDRVAYLRKRSMERGDELCTSHLALGEILAGAYRDKDEETARAIREGMRVAGIRLLSFDERAVDIFARIRADHRTSAADTIHLAAAAVEKVDLFLTGDKKLQKLHIPGIQFISDFTTAPL
ncbi:type II toxin-antitoxin system VapC family toxin [Terriglobus albidus]|uniref:Type II toxin-antitoxin system VapC family toxin n=1 Tax=Terriglobus albidus TaxID=1592106 RepID=A0A5B9ECZ0_9BACT|nr:PIN domain-containing protein [Terriglobus albidus]QEE29932.1 type II toxin-antitoxin system VapC family toxin [Terriglobus albidus]